MRRLTRGERETGALGISVQCGSKRMTATPPLPCREMHWGVSAPQHAEAPQPQPRLHKMRQNGVQVRGDGGLILCCCLHTGLSIGVTRARGWVVVLQMSCRRKKTAR